MNSSPLVSVVMATYNGEKYINLQIDSILKQTYQNIELIIVDDCSTDHTRELVREYCRKDSRVSLVCSERNRGVIETFQRGLKMARGEYVALSDQDDVFDLRKIEVLVNALERDKTSDLVVCDLRLIDANGDFIAGSFWKYRKLKPHSGKPFRQLLYKNFVTGCAMLFRRRLLDIAIPFPSDCLVHDWWLGLVASSDMGGGIVLVKEALVSYRQHSSNVVGAKSGSILSTALRIPDLAKRKASYTINKARIDGMISRHDLWCPHELTILRRASRLFDDLISAEESSFFFRLARIPDRIFFLKGQGIIASFAVIWLSLFPRFIDRFRGLLLMLQRRLEK